MRLLKHASLIMLFLLGGGMFMPQHTMADDNLDHSGQMQIQVDRIGQDEGERSAAQDPNETELEKILPDLFTKQTRAVIQSKQKDTKKTMEKLQQSLFEKPIKTAPEERVKTALFSGERYQDEMAADSQADIKQTNQKGISQTVWAALFGAFLAICGGLFVLVRQKLR
ncbi:type VII secretion protein EssA [Bacillus sp. BRMEA1]|uniref:type VII secretion protein EssA n=1 Tax=Neobacillus endophyticus TaxID=2738405 RepID=UPI00156663F8|nr:type VII secretion protein EssA [Neobacillus endophyticus]NRD77645.1 type VII secretion protein EssA [Neobacillus endophyticus]